MTLLTDSPDFARRVLPAATKLVPCPDDELGQATRELLRRLQPGTTWHASDATVPGFDRAILVEDAPGSQFDALREQGAQLPDGNTFCLAGSGRSFHGHHGRAWQTIPGNLHVSLVLSPHAPLPHFGALFMALPAVAVARAIESVLPAVPRVGIKWVNDIIVNGKKVAGVIAHTRSCGALVERVVLGLGVNVEARPSVERSEFVPAAGVLRDVDEKVTQEQVLSALLHHLDEAYRLALTKGPTHILDAYRERSLVLGRHVEIHPESGEPGDILRGRVTAIGNDLQLFLDGRSAPVVRGRLRWAGPVRSHTS